MASPSALAQTPEVPYSVAKAAGFSQGLQQATQRFDILVAVIFFAFTVNVAASTLRTRDKKLPLLEKGKSDEALIKIQDFTYWAAYGVVTIFFVVNQIGLGKVAPQ